MKMQINNAASCKIDVEATWETQRSTDFPRLTGIARKAGIQHSEDTSLDPNRLGIPDGMVCFT